MPGRCAVLIVDSDSSRLDRLERNARAAGLDVSTANSFAAAREGIRHSTPDVLIAALTLGAYNGLHLAVVAGQDDPATAALIFCDKLCTGHQADAASVNARLALADDLLQPQFWRTLATVRDLEAVVTSDTLRAIA